MKQGTRLYINITNHCNIDCPFCCMYSGTEKSTYMDKATFINIIDSTNGSFELQLEGGEPFCHREIYDFIDYAILSGRCSKLIILTNGLNLREYFDTLRNISTKHSIEVLIKVSVNYYILHKSPEHLTQIKALYEKTKKVKGFDILCNVRKRKSGDENLETKLSEFGLKEISNVFYLQSYGRLTGSDYDAPVIVQNIEDWKIYASDGTCFGTDLIARSQYEKGLA